MRRRETYRKLLWAALAVDILAILAFGYYALQKSIPDEIRILAGEEEKFSFSLPMEAEFSGENVGVLYVNQKPLTAAEISLDFSEPFTLRGETTASYSADIKLFGLIRLKRVNFDVVGEQSVIPGGKAIGIHVRTDGILVLGISKITGRDGIAYDPCNGRLKSGDYIVQVDDTPLQDKEELIQYLKKCDGSDLTFLLRRHEEEITVKVTPVEAADGAYKIGAWVRDDTQGIGTLTFITADGHFGALGHGITDIDTGLLMEVGTGDVYDAEIIHIVKGESGAPGELTGIISQSEAKRLGSVYKNTNQGIFGTLKSRSVSIGAAEAVEIGLKQEVKTGEASILCEVNGSIESYSIEIEKVDYTNSNHAKGIVIRITDEELIRLTGGIVQGMSGSPIIQNGKLVGAVTHVFIKDSTRGYGTFIENMLYSIKEDG